MRYGPPPPNPLVFFVLVLFIALFISACGEHKRVVEASCGQCQFGLSEPAGCDLAVRFEGKAYFVDGSHIDDHGDAHAARGMCNAIRKAEVIGEVKGERFVVRHLALID